MTRGTPACSTLQTLQTCRPAHLHTLTCYIPNPADEDADVRPGWGRSFFLFFSFFFFSFSLFSPFFFFLRSFLSFPSSPFPPFANPCSDGAPPMYSTLPCPALPSWVGGLICTVFFFFFWSIGSSLDPCAVWIHIYSREIHMTYSAVRCQCRSPPIQPASQPGRRRVWGSEDPDGGLLPGPPVRMHFPPTNLLYLCITILCSQLCGGGHSLPSKRVSKRSKYVFFTS